MRELLLVEDDPMLRELLAFHLEAKGWEVLLASDGREALDRFAERATPVVVLDVMLPGLNGLEVCAALRRTYDPSPGVLMLTARSQEADVVLGFEVGADDYVLKPCRPRELVARIDALHRRVSQRSNGVSAEPAALVRESGAIERGRIRIEPDARIVTVDGHPLRLTPIEYALLELLVQTPGQIHSRQKLLREVWDSSHEGYLRNVDCHITRLRRKLEHAGIAPAPIHTQHGAGYFFTTPAR